MKKNVFRNFDFVVRQTDKMKAIQKIVWSAYFFRFLLFIDSFLVLFFERDIDFWKKIIISQKWRWWRQPSVIPYKSSNRLIHAHISFIHFKPLPPRLSPPEQKTRISVTFCRFGAFPDLWRHLNGEFLSVSLDLAYRSNETFCSRTHRFG